MYIMGISAAAKLSQTHVDLYIVHFPWHYYSKCFRRSALRCSTMPGSILLLFGFSLAIQFEGHRRGDL